MSVKAGGIGIALFAAAGFLLVLAIIMLSVAFAYFITMIFDIDLAWSFLIVFVVYVLLAGLLGLRSASRRSSRSSPRSSAIEQAKEIPSAFKRSS